MAGSSTTQRSLFRRWLWPLSLFVLALPAQAAVFVVNTTLDGSDGVPGDGACDVSPVPPPSGLCSLRAAVEEANALAGTDEIRFSVGAGGIQSLSVTGITPIEVSTTLLIRGETQPGFVDVPLIHLDFGGGGAIPGLAITGDDVTVRSLRISGFVLDGVSLTGTGTHIEGSWIGLDAAGLPATNLRGLGVAGADHVIGGGAHPNVISGNFSGGVILGPAATGVLIDGNLIGTDPSGLVALGNGNAAPGVKIDGDLNVVDGNLISGNDSVGIWLVGDGNEVVGNTIGLGSGGVALGNAFAGVYAAEGADDNVIGGPLAADGNVISSNLENDFGQGGSGVFVAGAARTVILSNLIGTDATGKIARGNELHGIHITQGGTTPSLDTQIGELGPTDEGGNVIAANGVGMLGGHGVLVEQSDRTVMFNNRIGLGLGGAPSLPNAGDGVRLVESSESFLGGLPIFGAGPNWISQNQGAGVAVLDPDTTVGSQNTHGNSIRSNYIWDNDDLAIDLTRGSLVSNGVTANDPGDADFGPNRLQNFPLVTSVTVNGAGLATVTGTLETLPSTSFLIEVYDNDACDPSGHGELQTYVGADIISTDGSGNSAFSVQTMRVLTFPAAIAVVNDPNPNLTDTSEVSPCYLGIANAGVLGDFVWSDLDGDGMQDLTEPGVPDVTVRLVDEFGGLVAETTTNADGLYRFTGQASGMYQIEFDAPLGLIFTTADAGDDNLDSDADTLGNTVLFAYTAGTVDLSRDAGLVMLETAEIFQDGFETGNLSRWSMSVP